MLKILTKETRRKKTSSKQNDKQVNNDALRANRDFVHFSDLDTLSSVKRPKHSGVIWKKKGSSNTSNIELSSVSNSKLNKDVKRYSRKDLLYASYDVNDLFVFDDVSIKNSRVSKMSFRKKPSDFLNVHSKNNLNNSLPRTLVRWFPKMEPLAKPVAIWIPKIVQIYLWIIDSGCSKHMTGNRALLTNLVEKFLGTVHFGNNDFADITYLAIGEFCRKGLKSPFEKSTCFVRNEDGVDLLTGDRSSILYTIAINEIASTSPACLLAKASSSQSWLWHQCLSHLNFAIINNLVKNNLVREMASKQFNLEPGLSNLNKTGKSSNPTVSKVLESSKKDLEDLFHNFYDEYFDASKITKSPTMNVETSNDEIPSHEEEVLHESSESFPEESSSSSLNVDVQQSLDD
ncbi:retrovirus-related pol polyprotein from transposon TNT 1-94 [Tanacetum coccineum]